VNFGLKTPLFINTCSAVKKICCSLMLFSEVRSEWWSQEVLVGCVWDRILIQPTKTNQVNFLLFLNFQGLFPLTLSARVARERFELSAIIFSMLFLPVKSGGDPTTRTTVSALFRAY
jgi:hypothetical protein